MRELGIPRFANAATSTWDFKPHKKKLSQRFVVSLLCRLLNIEGTMESGLKMVKLFLVFVVLICATTTATPTTARTTTTNANGSSLSTLLTSLNQALENLVDMFQRKVKMDFLDKADKDWIFRIIWKLTCETKKYKKKLPEFGANI